MAKKKTTRQSAGHAITPSVPPASTAMQVDAPFRAFGRDILAPIIAEYLSRLHATVQAASLAGTPSLFCHRAGLRILQLYKAWLTARGEALPEHVRVFKTSRLAALKAAYATAPALSVTGIGMLLPGLHLAQVTALLLDGEHAEECARLAPTALHDFIDTDHPIAARLRAHLRDQSALMAAYLEQLAGVAGRVLLIDSGWAGTSQLILEQAFPNYAFDGVYFGTIGRATILDKGPGRMHGLVFNAAGPQYQSAAPETVFALHRHLIESLFEPDLPSVATLTPADLDAGHAAPSDDAIARPSCSWDAMYGIVLAAVSETATTTPVLRAQRYRDALAALTEVLRFPTLAQAHLAAGKFRSHDMGRAGGVAPLLAPHDRFDGDSAARRIDDALWAAGQAAVEYPDSALARAAQTAQAVRLTAAAPLADYFVSEKPQTGAPAERGDVAIITRTKNRPILLRRAAASVACQSFTNAEWIVVNDGGALADVLQVIEESVVDPSRITICHNRTSLGMEAASNAGIAFSSSQWLVIHDDDDSWHPDFLATSTGFLAANAQLYQGVITGTVLISEEIVGETISEISREPYQEWVKAVHLAEMATSNFFAPIAFVYSRAVYEQVGGYDPRLPVLGDWDFNLRFLLEADIGVISTPLAYYHHRNVGAASTYSNSVVGGIDKHIAYNAIVRNKYVREAARTPKMAMLAQLLNGGYLHTDTRARIDGALTHSLSRAGARGAAMPGRAADTDTSDTRWIMACALAGEFAASGVTTVAALMAGLQAKGTAAARSSDLVPPPDFDDAAYLAMYPDVAASITKGAFSCGFAHYILFGRHEGRIRPAA